MKSFWGEVLRYIVAMSHLASNLISSALASRVLGCATTPSVDDTLKVIFIVFLVRV